MGWRNKRLFRRRPWEDVQAVSDRCVGGGHTHEIPTRGFPKQLFVLGGSTARNSYNSALIYVQPKDGVEVTSTGEENSNTCTKQYRESSNFKDGKWAVGVLVCGIEQAIYSSRACRLSNTKPCFGIQSARKLLPRLSKKMRSFCGRKTRAFKAPTRIKSTHGNRTKNSHQTDGERTAVQQYSLAPRTRALTHKNGARTRALPLQRDTKKREEIRGKG